MKQYHILFAFLTGLFLQPLLAGGYETAGLGVRANKMGGAFTAVADDWSAIFWNPAGLTQLSGNGAGGYFDFLRGDFYDRNGIKNFTAATFNIKQNDIFQKIYSSEPGTLPVRHSSADGANPSNGFYLSFDDGLKLGFGTFVPLGSAAEFDGSVHELNDGAVIGYNFSNSFFLLVNNLSVAKKINDKMAIGIGADITYGELELDVEKTYTGGFNPDYTFGLNQQADGTVVTGVLGLMFFPNDDWRLGFTYHTGGTMELEGKAAVLHTATGVDESSKLDSRLFLPATYNFGLAWQVNRDWLLSADWELTDWRGNETKIIYKNQGVALRSVDLRAGWRLSQRYRIGSDWRFSPTYSFQAGYTYDQSAMPKRSLSLTGLIDVNQHIFTFGPTWRLDDLTLDLAYRLAYGSRTLGNGNRYEQILQSILVEASIVF